MEKYENEKHSRVSWIVFLFSISVVLISLSPVVFPALFSETFFKSEFDNAGILQHVVIEPFEIGGLAIPLIVTNIIVFGIFYFSKSRGLLEKIDFLTKFQVTKKIAIIALIVIIAGYISISINEIEIGKKALVGAGSTLTKNVKDKSLALTRTNQVEIKNYKKK